MNSPRSRRNRTVAGAALAGVLAFSLLALAGGVDYFQNDVGDDYEAIGSLAGAANLGAATGMYVKFEGVDGESTDKDHRNWSDLASFTQGQSLPPSGTDSSRRSGSVVFEDFLCTKELDKASPKLAESVCKGKVFPKVEIHVTASYTSAGRATYYAYELKNVRIVGYYISGGAQSGLPLMEELVLTFSEIKVTYTEYDAAGYSQGNVEYSWKLQEGPVLAF